MYGVISSNSKFRVTRYNYVQTRYNIIAVQVGEFFIKSVIRIHHTRGRTEIPDHVQEPVRRISNAVYGTHFTGTRILL